MPCVLTQNSQGFSSAWHEKHVFTHLLLSLSPKHLQNQSVEKKIILFHLVTRCNVIHLNDQLQPMCEEMVSKQRGMILLKIKLQFSVESYFFTTLINACKSALLQFNHTILLQIYQLTLIRYSPCNVQLNYIRLTNDFC